MTRTKLLIALLATYIIPLVILAFMGEWLLGANWLLFGGIPVWYVMFLED